MNSNYCNNQPRSPLTVDFGYTLAQGKSSLYPEFVVSEIMKCVFNHKILTLRDVELKFP